MTEVRTPAQAAYEAFVAQVFDHAAPEVLAGAGMNWDHLLPEQHEVWRQIANAAMLAVMHCDRTEGGLAQGQRVRKTGGDYSFTGNVAVLFAKRSGEVRVVVEDDRGLLLILKPDQVRAASEEP